MIAESLLEAVPSQSELIPCQEEAFMFEDARTKTHRRRGRRCRAGSTDPEFDAEVADRLGAVDVSLLTDEERALEVARRRADEKIALARACVRAALITLPLLVFVPFAGALALVCFGVALGRKAFRLFCEPQLRERFLQEEVQRRVHTHVRSERQHLEGQHQRSLEELSASIAHEIRNPITAAKSLVQQMSEDPNGEDQAEYARVAVAELERVERSVSHLLRYAREEETRFESIEIEDVVESAIETFRDRCLRNGVEILRQYDTAGPVEGDPEQLRRVVINLVQNGLDALEAAEISQPEMRISIGENLAGTEVWLRVADNGPGMDEETRSRIFDPFFTSREAGTGLGLALCSKVVDAHGGTIEVDSTAEEGAEFVLTLPRRRLR